MYQYSYPSTHSISGLAAGSTWEQLDVCRKMTIMWTQRYSLRLWSSKFADALGGGSQACLEIHLEAVIDRAERCPPGSWLIESVNALRSCNRASVEIPSEDAIERGSRCTSRPWWCELRTHDRAGLEAVITGYWRCTFRQWWCELGGSNCAGVTSTSRRSMDGSPGAETPFIS